MSLSSYVSTFCPALDPRVFPVVRHGHEDTQVVTPMTRSWTLKIKLENGCLVGASTAAPCLIKFTITRLNCKI